MRRGSTPPQIFDLNIDLREAVVFITYNQSGETVIERTNDSIEIRENQIEFTLTQEETLKFKEGNVDIQIRYRFPDGSADASSIMNVRAERILKEGVI